MLDTAKKQSQSERIKNYLSTMPSDYTFTVTRLQHDLKRTVPGLSNGGVSGFIAKLAQRGVLQKMEARPGEKAATFKIVGDIEGVPTKSTPTVGSLPGRVLKNRAARLVTGKPVQTTISKAIIQRAKPVRTQQAIMDEMVELMAELGKATVNLSTVPTEALLKELMDRETSKETK